jgi:hypothetical protein
VTKQEKNKQKKSDSNYRGNDHDDNFVKGEQEEHKSVNPLAELSKTGGEQVKYWTVKITG